MSAESPSSTSPASSAPGLRRLPFTIRLSPQLVNRLLSSPLGADTPRAGIQGLFFGVFDQNLVVAQSLWPFPENGEGVSGRSGRAQDGEFEQRLTAARKDPAISPLELVGWYTTRANGGLLQTDIQFHEQYFPNPNHLAVVLKPEGSANVLLELYCRSASGVLSDEAHRWGAVRLTTGAALVGPVEVTMRTKIQDDLFLRAYQAPESKAKENDGPVWKKVIPLTTRKAIKLFHSERSLETAEASESAPAMGTNTNTGALQKTPPSAVPNAPTVLSDARERRGIPWLSSALVFAVAAGLTFGLVYSRGFPSADGMPGFLKGFFIAPGLSLRLESQGDRILLSWNRRHPAVRNARSGVLQIDDGPVHRRVKLDAAQVANGSVLYRPNSDDLTFRLEVEGAGGERASESMRVLEGPKPSTLDLSAPGAASPIGQVNGLQSQSNNGSDFSPPTQKSTAIITQPPSSASQQYAQPPPPKPMDVPVKKDDARGDVAYDVLSPKPVQTTQSEPAPQVAHSAPLTAATPQGETPQNTAPLPTNSALPLATERQTPLPAPDSALPAALPTQPRPGISTIYRAPRPLRQVLPNVKQVAPGVIATAGRVEVIVKVNENGRVTEAHIVNGSGKINAGLAGASILAARQWIFEPATLSGKPVPSEHSIVFQFQPPQ